MRQRPLHLAGRPDYSFAALVEGESNRDVLIYLSAYPDWPSPVVLIIGPEGSGKTHIGRAAAERSALMFVDDAHGVAEDELFALINHALSGEIPGLVLASRKAPTDWNIAMPDLLSRMANIPVFTLEEPGDDILRPILVQLFYNHGRIVGADTVDFMLTRCPRGVRELEELVAAIEADAQSQRADVTKTFVSRFLARQPDLFEV